MNVQQLIADDANRTKRCGRHNQTLTCEPCKRPVSVYDPQPDRYVRCAECGGPATCGACDSES